VWRDANVTGGEGCDLILENIQNIKLKDPGEAEQFEDSMMIEVLGEHCTR
jgi:hypothetical protein